MKKNCVTNNHNDYEGSSNQGGPSLQRRTIPYENNDLSDHPGIGSGQADIYALSYFQKAGYPSPPAEIYESVFCGETEVATLEEIYRIFNRKDEADARYLEKIGFTGHSMSVSDILEIQHSPGESRFYFCDTFGFSQIAFQKENAMLPVQNHDNIPFEQVNRSKPGYLAYMDNGGISIHPCIQVQLQRCKYSQCQLGYRLRYQEKEESPWRQRDFLERPAVLLFEDTQKNLAMQQTDQTRSSRNVSRKSRHALNRLTRC